jgi:hypothetical protein
VRHDSCGLGRGFLSGIADNEPDNILRRRVRDRGLGLARIEEIATASMRFGAFSVPVAPVFGRFVGSIGD